MTDEHLADRVLVSRRYRNRRIGDFLKELEIVEGRNTGVPLILSSMQNNGSALPSFETDEDRSYFLTVLPIHPFFKKQEENSHTEKQSAPVSSRRNRGELKALILDALSVHGNLSTNKLANALGYKKVTDTLREVVNEMLLSGEVCYLYPDKPRSRNQKICLVKK